MMRWQFEPIVRLDRTSAVRSPENRTRAIAAARRATCAPPVAVFARSAAALISSCGLVGLTGVVLVLVGLLASQSFADGAAAPTAGAELDRRIGKLIEELGADQFVVRENSQAELQRLGPVAFDALDQARHHPDVEVSMRVRYLLRVMAVDWSLPTDPLEVKGALKGYGDQNEGERRNRMERLGAFEGGRGAPALCRLARFEASQILAKHAALLVMQQPLPATPAERTALAKTILGTVDTSKRTAAAWLRLYAKTLETPLATVDDWQKVTLAELQAVKGSSESTDREIVRELLRWQSDFFRRIDRPAEALATARRMIDIVEDTPTELGDLVGWLVDRKLWPLVQEIAERHADDFERSALLQYRHAEALQRQGEQEKAEKVAERAAGLQADNASAHFEVAIDLRERGLFAWAEREFRAALKVVTPGDSEDLKARYRLAEMLFDMQRSLDAAKVWQEFVDRFENDKELKQRFGNQPLAFRSRMHYFYADHYGQAKDRAKQEEHLDLGIGNDPTDADVLIALFRLPDQTPERREKTKNLINAAAKNFEQQIERLDRFAVNQLQPEQRELFNDQLANFHNQYAWLVANTEGNFDEALRCGLRAVELKPKTSSYLDTLAHCYYAKKDFANAVKYQTIAVQREPHSTQIRRQLGVFQKALDDQRGAKPPVPEKPASTDGAA